MPCRLLFLWFRKKNRIFFRCEKRWALLNTRQFNLRHISITFQELFKPAPKGTTCWTHDLLGCRCHLPSAPRSPNLSSDEALMAGRMRTRGPFKSVDPQKNQSLRQPGTPHPMQLHSPPRSRDLATLAHGTIS